MIHLKFDFSSFKYGPGYSRFKKDYLEDVKFTSELLQVQGQSIPRDPIQPPGQPNNSGEYEWTNPQGRSP